jgi:tetratricopeptide (TPR) repeat protein
MRRFVFPVLFYALLLCTAAWCRQTAQPLPDPALQNAPAPRPYDPPSPSATAAELESRGDEFRQEKAYRDAIDYFRTALTRTHDKTMRAALYNKIGISELQLQNYKEAVKNFEHALKMNSELVAARNNLGASFYGEKKYPKAIKEYREALRHEEDNASFHSNLATALFAHKEIEAAMAEYLRAFQLDPAVLDRSSRVGISAKMMGTEDRAQYSYMLARMYAKMGDLDHSLLYLKKAMEDGYKKVDDVYKDQEFTALRGDPRFTELMAARPVAITQ